MITADGATTPPAGNCAALAEAWQAGAPTYRAITSTDMDTVRSAASSTITSIHLAAYTSSSAHGYLQALIQGLAACGSYTEPSLHGSLAHWIHPRQLTSGDEAVAWQETAHSTVDGYLYTSIAVIRVGSTVLTFAVTGPSDASQPLPNRTLLAAQIAKLRAIVH